MVSVIEVVRLLKTSIPDVHFFPLEFPLSSHVDSACVSVSSGSRSVAKVFTINVQVKVRGEHPITAEEHSQKIIDFLEKKTDFNLGNVQVILSESQNSVPLFLGKDGEGRYLYSNNFKFMCNQGGN